MQGHQLYDLDSDANGDLDTDVDKTVRTVVARHFALDPAELTEDLSFDELGLDERTATILLSAVGDELDVRFPDDFFDGVDTYAQLTSAVRIAIGP